MIDHIFDIVNNIWWDILMLIAQHDVLNVQKNAIYNVLMSILTNNIDVSTQYL